MSTQANGVRRQAILFTLVAFVIGIASAHEASGSSAENARQATAARTDGRLSLRLASDSSNRRNLQLVRDAVELASFRVPPDATDVNLADGVTRALWNPARTMVAVAVARTSGTCVLAFLQREDGQYVARDISEVEFRIIGAIGPFRTYVRRETMPLAWEDWGEGQRVLRVQTTVWDQMGKRYRGSDVVLFSKDGVPLWR